MFFRDLVCLSFQPVVYICTIGCFIVATLITFSAVLKHCTIILVIMFCFLTISCSSTVTFVAAFFIDLAEECCHHDEVSVPQEVL